MDLFKNSARPFNIEMTCSYLDLLKLYELNFKVLR